MKFKRISKKLTAAFLTGVLMVSMLGMTVCAEEEMKEPTGNVTGSVSFNKTLDMSNAPGASIPDVTFSYNITGGNGVAATASNPQILSGTDSSVTGLPVVGTADFDVMSSYATADLTKTVSVDFSNVAFSKPGIYRYVITEQAAGNADVTNDAQAVRYLDVYVINGASTNTYEIAHFVLLTSADTPDLTGKYPTQKVDDVEKNSKSSGFTNQYQTYQLTLSKTVTGAMADLSRTFDFTIAFTGGLAGATFTYQLGNNNPTTVTLDRNGAGSITGIALNNNTGSAVITGIPSTVSYTITENLAATEGYTTTYKIDLSETAVENTTTGSQTMGKSDHSVAFTNERAAITPTGVIMTIAPFVLMVALAGVFAVLFLRRRRNEY